MEKVFFLVSLVLLVGSNLFSAPDHYDVYIRPGQSRTITFKCWQAVPSYDKEGSESMVDTPHLWRLLDRFNKEVIRINDEKDKEGRSVYDLGGEWKISATNIVKTLALMPFFFAGLLVFGPYEQEYVFDAIAVGTTRLIFLCEKRYCTNVVTKKVTIDFHVNEGRSGKRSLYVK